MNLLDYAHQIMINRVNANNFKSSEFNEITGGLDAYIFYKGLLNKELGPIVLKLKDLYMKVFNRNNLVINITSDFSNKENLFNRIEEFTSKLNSEVLEEIPYDFEAKMQKEAFITSTDVSYVSIGNDLGKFDYKYKGDATVISNIISNAYLYNEIRAKGGAYGAGMVINNKNTFATFSYRDPNIANTLNVYDNIAHVMASLSLRDEDLKPFIIGAIGKFDPALTEKGKGLKDLDMYLTGKDYKTLESYVEEAKNTDLDKVKDLAEVINKAKEDMSMTVLSNSANIENNKDLFTNIIDLR